MAVNAASLSLGVEMSRYLNTKQTISMFDRP